MIVLMRHAQTIGGQGRCIGRTAVPLSEAGLDQAKGLVEQLGGGGFVRLCSSPSQRAMETIAPLAESLGKTVGVISDLDEIDMGEWDGVSFDIIRQQYPDDYADRGARFGDFRPPGGESFYDVANRAMAALDVLSKGDLPVLVATHAGVIRSVLCRVTGHPMDDLFHFKPSHAHCTLLNPSAHGLELVAVGVAPQKVQSLFCSQLPWGQ